MGRVSMSNVVPIMATGYLPSRERERLKELWTQLAGASAEKGFADGLLEELFESQSESLRDRIHLVSASIEERKGLGVRTSHEAQKRREDIEVALQQFPMMTCCPHVERRRSHLERELDELLRDLNKKETSAWKDLHGLYRDMFYLLYKERTLETVRRAVQYK